MYGKRFVIHLVDKIEFLCGLLNKFITAVKNIGPESMVIFQQDGMFPVSITLIIVSPDQSRIILLR